MKKTKIVCTLGPASDTKEVMRELALNGMDVARFNFSHGDQEEHQKRLAVLQEVREELDLPIAALLDTRGPEIRTGLLKEGKPVMLTEGGSYVLTSEETEGDEKHGFVNYPGLAEELEAGDHILIDDGLIELEVREICGSEIFCRIINGGELGERKGINVPGVKIGLPALTEKDREDIRFGVRAGFDFVAASFVRNAEAVRQIRRILEEEGSSMQIIAKIENAEGIENIDEIIEASDGIMVARGDLGVEIPEEKVPYLQKMLIRKANDACKVVITATQMLDSMIRNPRPTRAEVTDVANAVYDGTDAVMLSGETAMGRYPVEAVRMMSQIAEDSEQHAEYESYRRKRFSSAAKKGISSTVCYAAAEAANDLNAHVIVAPSITGFTARMLSKWRPEALIAGLSPSMGTVRQMQLYWGVKPFQAKRAESTDILIYSSVELLKEKKLLKKGETAVATAGVVTYEGRHKPAADTNIIRVVEVE